MLRFNKKLFTILFYIIFAVYFRIILDVNAQTSKLSPIEIVNITDDVVFNAGEELMLICKCNGCGELYWSSYTTEDEDQGGVKISEFDNNTNTFSTKLIIPEASYLNVGYYACSTNNYETENRLVYVFVNDTNRIFLNAPEDIDGEPNENTIIPCRATSPDIQFNLTRNGTKALNLISYDHKDGATVYLNGTLDQETYTCIGSNTFNVTEKLEIIVRYNKPTTKIPTIKNESGSHFVGHQLKLSCMLKLDNVEVQTWWNWPSTVKQSDSRVQSNYTNGITTLTLTNLSIEDSGNYTCYFENHDQNQTITINVKDKPYIYLTSDSALEPVSANMTEEVIFIVGVDAYPPVKEYLWLFNNNKITPTINYRIKNSPNESKLSISSVSLNDDGQYMLRATNGEVNQTIDITLKILQKPSVSITGPSYILLDNKKKFNCTAVGSPIPEIHWSFKCLSNEKCPSEPRLNKDFEITVKSFKITSIYILKTNVSGTLLCEANNTAGSDSNLKKVLITDIPDGDEGFNVWKEIANVSVGDSVVLHCGVSTHNLTKQLEWYLNNSIPIKSNNDYKIVNFSTRYSYRSNIEILNITKDSNGNYKCVNGLQAKSVQLNVVDAVSPMIYNTNLNGTAQIKLAERKTFQYYCHAKGMPIPIITWKKDNKLLEPDQKRIEISKDNQTLTFKYTIKNDTGLYTCQVSNRLGTITIESKLVIGGGTGITNKISHWIIIVPIVSILLLIISIIFLYIKLRNEKRQIAKFENVGLSHFGKGDVKCINPNLAIDDQADLLPYYNEWEFSTEKLKLGKVLGAGAFGVVVKAEAQGILDGEDSTTVAVKMVKKNADMIYVKALVSELKIMVHLGRHVNIANLLGACTKNLVSKRELLVIVEYCRYGNLLNYLQRYRRDFVNQIDPSTGDFNFTIGIDDVDGFRGRWLKNVNSPLHTTVSFFNRTVAGVDYRAEPEPSISPGADVPTTPFDKRRDTVKSNKSEQPEWRSNYQAEYYDHKAPLCSKDLLCFAFQIARGMEYLVSRRVLHGDLAARNVLVAENNIIKICDFGLAKSIYKDSNYVRNKKCPLPMKWMALESIRDQIFSVQSDVWSYGVVLWELFSLGQSPYSEIVDIDKFYQKLEDGYRLQKPEFATKKIYQIMLQCWEVRPKNRPLFDKLVNDVGMMLENADREHHMNLNRPYLMMNDMKKKDQKDYLAMMSTPDFEKISSSNHYIDDPHTTCNTANKNNSSHSNNDYVSMRPLIVSNGLDDSIKTKKLPTDTDSSEISPKLSLNTTSDTKYDIQSDSELTTPDFKNINENSVLNPTYFNN